MGKIAVLDQQTIDQIAAGEVVERPASVVKELVENAIDARSTQVTVEIREGGVGMIRITDNGIGMEKEDIPLAFLRHSTSKIRSAEDLPGVSSLGFRGEALSSICAVSMVELITKPPGSMQGMRCCMEGGVQKSLEEIGAADGTTLIMRNLFYNTPARRKFLKTDMTEAAAIHEVMTCLALSHPEISFKVLIHNQLKLQTSGNGSLKDVVYQIYGRDIARGLIPMERTEGPITIGGFIGKPEISRGNRKFETYFINGRYIKSRIVAKGLEDAYKSFMMQHRYPFVCLDLKIDAKLLDVNVHPAKMEVRFSDQNLVYDTIFRAVQEALSQKELIPEVTFGKTKEKPPEKSGGSQETQREQTEEKHPAAEEQQKPPLEKMWKVPQPSAVPEVPQDKNLDYFMEEMKKRVEKRHAQSQPQSQPQILKDPADYEKKTEAPEQLDLFDGKLLSKEAAIRHVLIGQLFDTYWLVQYGDKLYIIDQHAAHEKVLYERLMKELREQKPQSQLLSPPIILNVSMSEEQLYLKCRQQFADMGFEIEKFGERVYAVYAVPANLPGIASGELLTELLDSLSDISGTVSSDSLLDKVASMSCKAAVKGRHQMSAMEAKALIDELLTLDNPYNCPHGRPTIISMTKYELEKKFKRIV